MTQLLSMLNFAISIYMVLIFFRIILTWFSWTGNSGLLDFLARITDPYLNWFRRLTFLRMGFMDLSPIVAIGVLSLINRLISSIALHRAITIGIILSMVLMLIWGVVSFILVFFIIVLLLRLACHLSRQSVYGTFWRIVDSISQPVLYRINRIIFRDRIVNFPISIIVSIASLGICYIAIRYLVVFLSGLLAGLPI